MSHLTHEHAAAVAFGEGEAAHRAHAGSCPACRTLVRQLAELAHEAGSLDVPEPPADYWAGFAGRVNEAVGRPPDRARTWTLPSASWMGIAAALILLVGALLAITMRQAPDAAIVGIALAPADGGSAALDREASGNDEAWAIVQSAADDLDYDAALEAGIVARPGSLERAAAELSDDERAELIRLIRTEIKRVGA